MEIEARTRERKRPQCGLDALRKEWKARLTKQERQVLASVYCRETPFIREIDGEAVAVDEAIQHCFTRQAVVPERTLITEALRRGIGAVMVEHLAREVANRALIRNDVNGRTMVALRRD